MNSPVLWPAGPAAQAIAVIGWVLFIGAAVIFAGVMLLLARALQQRETPRRVRPALWLIGGGVVFPAVVLSALLGWSVALSARLAEPAPPGAMVVSITGHMWWWEVRLRDPASGADVVLANELRLPVGRKIVVGLNSADVIHSFWVPALSGKVDAVDELSIDVSLACGERLLAHDRYRVVQREAEAAQRRITSVSRLTPSRRS